MVFIASIMRLCIAGTLIAAVTGSCQVHAASMVLRGSKPKLLCSERTRPRTATMDDVTRTAQMAI
jgi:uncharacterized membrane protein YraQ (UPF0718 family)